MKVVSIILEASQQRMLSLRLHVSLVPQFIAHDLPQRQSKIILVRCGMAASIRVEQRTMLGDVPRCISCNRPGREGLVITKLLTDVSEVSNVWTTARFRGITGIGWCMAFGHYIH